MTPTIPAHLPTAPPRPGALASWRRANGSADAVHIVTDAMPMRTLCGVSLVLIQPATPGDRACSLCIDLAADIYDASEAVL